MFHVEHPNLLAHPQNNQSRGPFQNKFYLMFHVEHLNVQTPPKQTKRNPVQNEFN
jgi:hypothetical protein